MASFDALEVIDIMEKREREEQQKRMQDYELEREIEERMVDEQNASARRMPGKDYVYVPIERKLNLTVREAAEYSNIGQNKLALMLRHPMCSFVLHIGTKRLVKRKEFEEYLRGRIEI